MRSGWFVVLIIGLTGCSNCDEPNQPPPAATATAAATPPAPNNGVRPSMMVAPLMRSVGGDDGGSE